MVRQKLEWNWSNYKLTLNLIIHSIAFAFLGNKRYDLKLIRGVNRLNDQIERNRSNWDWNELKTNLDRNRVLINNKVLQMFISKIILIVWHKVFMFYCIEF